MRCSAHRRCLRQESGRESGPVVLSYPDRPYLVWSYRNGRGQVIQRNNPRDFADAAANLYQWLRRYRDYSPLGGDVVGTMYPLPAKFQEVRVMLAQTRDEDGGARHGAWLEVIAGGRFGFKETVKYVEKGSGSWKEEALGTIEDLTSNEGTPIPCPPNFLSSNWKLFHDALQAHRFFILNEMLPAYGILSI